jgi:hypothetical protein
MPDYPKPVPAHDVWSREKPADLPIDNSEQERQGRIIHGRNRVEMEPGQTDQYGRIVSPDGSHYGPGHDLNTNIPQWVPGVNGTMPARPQQGPVDRRPRGEETNKFIDDGGPHRPRSHQTRNPNEYRTREDAEAAAAILRQQDPTGNYLVASASSNGDLWIIARRGEVDLVFDSTSHNQPT